MGPSPPHGVRGDLGLLPSTAAPAPHPPGCCHTMPRRQLGFSAQPGANQATPRPETHTPSWSQFCSHVGSSKRHSYPNQQGGSSEGPVGNQNPHCSNKGPSEVPVGTERGTRALEVMRLTCLLLLERRVEKPYMLHDSIHITYRKR